MKFEEKLYKTKKAVTFDDVLIQPAYSEVSIADVDVSTNVTRNIRIEVPVVSSPMDTVTEASMAKAMALRGGVGVIHYNCSVEDQKKHVAAVKKENLLVGAAAGPHDDERVKVLMDEEVDFIVIDTAHGHRKSVIDAIKRYKKEGAEIIGGNIVSAKAAEDLISAGADGLRVGVGPGSICLGAGALVLMGDYSVKPIQEVKPGDYVITHKGRARKVTKVYEREYEGEVIQVKAEGNARYVSATPNHPFSVFQNQGLHWLPAGKLSAKSVLVSLSEEKINEPVYLNVEDIGTLYKKTTVYNLEVEEDESYVADRVAVHNCTTRVITGIGVPQLTAVSEVADYASKYKVPVIADGGIKYSGDLAKAIAAGADCGMLGNALAGTDEAPGEIVKSEDKMFKRYRGMGSVDSLKANYAHRYDAFKKSLVPEGVSGLIKYKGSVDDVITQFEGGLKKAMVYVGAKNIEEFKKKAFFVRITQTGLKESHPHSLLEMEDAVNYSREE
ncbi:IMP dehydrogenase [Candidatus Micrarchaeota archaeon]|nr:IMP dehydrogenase [Candidatus Micrarchaeota archaeon]